MKPREPGAAGSALTDNLGLAAGFILGTFLVSKKKHTEAEHIIDSWSHAMYRIDALYRW